MEKIPKIILSKPYLWINGILRTLVRVWSVTTSPGTLDQVQQMPYCKNLNHNTTFLARIE